MKTFQLFRIYHSFLLKKWYLLLYIFVIIIAAFGTLLIIQQSQQDNTTFNIGVVDEDDTKETRLILKSLGNGNNLGKDIRITPYTQRQAHKKLQQHQLDGYYVFKDGMTKTFYRNGSLPITVYTYDKQSTQSITLNQLTDSVYDRLMGAMGGGLTYNSLAPDATKNDNLKLLTDLLFTGLNRTGTFDYHPMTIYHTGSYYVVTGYLASIFIVCLSLFSILKMNQEKALKDRLTLFHFAVEKLILIRSLFTFIYTLVWAILGLLWMLLTLPNAFEMYNWPTLALHILYYVIMITLVLTIIELQLQGLKQLSAKILFTLVILVLSGITLPTIYFSHLLGGLFAHQPFSLVTNQLLELVLNNYILDISPLFYSSLIVLSCWLIGLLVWRYRT